MTDLDKTLREMAVNNWEQFVDVIGEKAIMKAKICILRKSDVSYNRIVVKLGVTLQQARSCNICPAKE